MHRKRYKLMVQDGNSHSLCYVRWLAFGECAINQISASAQMYVIINKRTSSISPDLSSSFTARADYCIHAIYYIISFLVFAFRHASLQPSCHCVSLIRFDSIRLDVCVHFDLFAQFYLFIFGRRRRPRAILLCNQPPPSSAIAAAAVVVVATTISEKPVKEKNKCRWNGTNGFGTLQLYSNRKSSIPCVPLRLWFTHAKLNRVMSNVHVQRQNSVVSSIVVASASNMQNYYIV